MKKIKQIMAWIGIIVLVGLYLVTFILGVTGNESTKGLLMASIACTVIVPCLMYAMMMIARVLKGKNDTPESKEQNEKKRLS